MRYSLFLVISFLFVIAACKPEGNFGGISGKTSENSALGNANGQADGTATLSGDGGYTGNGTTSFDDSIGRQGTTGDDGSIDDNGRIGIEQGQPNVPFELPPEPTLPPVSPGGFIQVTQHDVLCNDTLNITFHLVLDVTTSMTAALNTISANINQFSSNLKNILKDQSTHTVNLSFQLSTFRDYTDNSPDVHATTTSVNAFNSLISGSKPFDNGENKEWPENSLRALELTVQNKVDASRTLAIVLVVSDNFAHRRRVTGGLDYSFDTLRALVNQKVSGNPILLLDSTEDTTDLRGAPAPSYASASPEAQWNAIRNGLGSSVVGQNLGFPILLSLIHI